MVSVADVARKVVHAPIVRVGTEEAWKPVDVVYLAVRYLAGQCDGARTPDGVGFNRLDTDFGTNMANMPVSEWRPRQLWAARKMIAKYEKTQLRFLAQHLPTISDERAALGFLGRPPQQVRTNEPPASKPGVGPVRRLRLMTDEHGQRIVLIFHEWTNASSDLLRTVRKIPGVKWDYGAKRRTCLITAETLTNLSLLISEYGFHISDADLAELRKTVDQYEAAVHMSHAKSADLIIPGFGGGPFDLQPFPFQRAGILYAMEKLAEQQGVLIADEMGLGKTIQGLGVIQAMDLFPFVVICPASIKKNWQREARTWFGVKRTIAHLGTKLFSLNFMGIEAMCDGAVVNYNVRTLKKWQSELVAMRPKAIILDEMHNLKNGSAQQTKVVKEIIAQTGVKVIGMTGTPVVNKPAEFWQLVSILGQAHKLAPTFGAFMDRYGTNTERDLHELNLRSRQHFMVRRLKRDVLKDLPPKLRDAVYLDLDNREEYDAAEADLAHYYGTKKAEDAKFEATCREAFMNARRFVSDGPALSWEDFFKKAKAEQYGHSYAMAAAHEALMRWDILKQCAVKGKKAAAFEWIDTFLDSTDEKLVLFIWHNEFGKEVATRYGADCINGEMAVDLRDPAVQRFQTDPKRRVIVGNLQAMGEGLTLTASSTVAFLELGWNPKQMGQAEDRCHRIGQHDTVNVHWLVAEGTIEDEITAIIQGKMKIVDAIQDGPGIPTQGDVMRELAQRLDKRMAAA